MARAHAASACVQSDSIKGLAQSIAKPAYHRQLIAEPALRRAVPTLIIAFLITICLGAFVQVVDQSRQKQLEAFERGRAILPGRGDAIETFGKQVGYRCEVALGGRALLAGLVDDLHESAEENGDQERNDQCGYCTTERRLR